MENQQLYKSKNSINSLADLRVGEVYYATLSKRSNDSMKIQVLGIVNEKDEFIGENTEIYARIFYNNKYKMTSIFNARGIGVGMTPKDALENYGRFESEQNESFFTSFNIMKKENSEISFPIDKYIFEL